MLTPRRNKKSTFLIKRRQQRVNMSLSPIEDFDKPSEFSSLGLSLSNLPSPNDSFSLCENSEIIFENTDRSIENVGKSPPHTERLHIYHRDPPVPPLIIPYKNEELPTKSLKEYYAYAGVAIAVLIVSGFFYIKRRSS